ncbi:MAG: hypothetical protein KF858_01275 [Candidatus Sumerlaeia bacterium]|nr:hypothetical protein [Candidatus Sumerlaeia bacterium]
MPLYFYPLLDCPPRQALGPHELALRAHDRLLCQTLGQGPDGPLPDETPLGWEVRGADGRLRREDSTLGACRARARVLEAHEPACAGCPAAMAGVPFSCIQAISFPISARAERWLLERIGPPESLTATFFRFSARGMGYGVDCEVLDQWRRAGLIESPEPLRAFDDRGAANGDQVLHALLLAGDLDRGRVLGALIFLRALDTPLNEGTDAVLPLVSAAQANRAPAGEAPALKFVLSLESDGDHSTDEFRGFLIAAWVSLQAGVPLAVWMGP